MPNFKLLSAAERTRRRHIRAFKKQARRRLKRREKILDELEDPLAAMIVEYTFLGERGEGDPVMLLPTRELRQRVRDLNRRVSFFSNDPPSFESLCRPDPARLNCRPPDPAERPFAPPRPPRPHGRSSSVFRHPLLPMMPDQQRALCWIVSSSFSQQTGLGRRHYCMRCRPSTGRPVIDVPTLLVYPTAAGDLVFRCHRCGFCLDSVEFVRQSSYTHLSFGQIAHRMLDDGLLSGPLPAEQIAGYERLCALRTLFERGCPRFKASLEPGRTAPLYGDWALLTTESIRPLFPDVRLPESLPAECWGRVTRDVFGRWSSLQLYRPRGCLGLYAVELRSWEEPPSVTIAFPRWADFLDLRSLILCSRNAEAFKMERAVANWPDAHRLPVAVLERAGAINEPVVPFEEVWAVTASGRAGFALPWCLPATPTSKGSRVWVRRLPPDIGYGQAPGDQYASRSSFCDHATASECIADVAGQVAAESDYQPVGIALADVLRERGLQPQTRRRLIEEVGHRTGLGVQALVPEGFNPWTGSPYALNATGGTVFVAREGRYWRRGRRDKEFSAVSNFTVRLLEGRVGSRGRIAQEAVLEINGMEVELVLTGAEINSAKRLMNALSRAAVAAGAEYPMISDSKAKRLLAELVKATRPPLASKIPTEQ